jgi:hypothetical protein
MIKGWYYQCRLGARVVGTCAHVASVVWFLRCARHRDIDLNYSVDWSAYLIDAKDLPVLQLIDDNEEASTEEQNASVTLAFSKSIYIILYYTLRLYYLYLSLLASQSIF